MSCKLLIHTFQIHIILYPYEHTNLSKLNKNHQINSNSLTISYKIKHINSEIRKGDLSKSDWPNVKYNSNCSVGDSLSLKTSEYKHWSTMITTGTTFTYPLISYRTTNNILCLKISKEQKSERGKFFDYHTVDSTHIGGKVTLIFFDMT